LYVVQVKPKLKRIKSSPDWRRSRRLHVFFGGSFPIDEVLYSEKIRPSSFSETSLLQHFHLRQPLHVHPHRLNRFFGERVKDKCVESPMDEREPNEEDSSISGPRVGRTQRIQRFFGERIDPNKEASAVSFANQPAHVKGHRLRKIFGTPPVHNEPIPEEEGDKDEVDQQGPSLETRRAHKLHKFFGKKPDEDLPNGNSSNENK